MQSAGVESPAAEARWIVEAATGRPGRPSALTGHNSGARGRARGMARRRAAGEPLQYVIGDAGFRTLDLLVGPGVLVPRPETEVVAEEAIRLLPRGGTLVDVGTGSGAIALSVKAEHHDSTVVATEISDEAARWARRNRALLDLDVEILLGDLLEPLSQGLRGRIDVVVSNPPYISTREASTLPRDVVDHEPGVALFAGEDGLSLIRRLVGETTKWLKPTGWLVLEIGATQGGAVRDLLSAAGYTKVAVTADLAGRDRVAIGTRP